MDSFEGHLDQARHIDGKLSLRFLEGGLDPAPEDLPVFVVSVVDPQNAEAVMQALNDMMSKDDWSYVSVSEREVEVEFDLGQRLVISGQNITWGRAGYEVEDYRRLAKRNYDWGRDQYRAWSAEARRLILLRELIHAQHARVTIKAAGHEFGSTARTLYEQQLSFLERLLREPEA